MHETYGSVLSPLEVLSFAAAVTERCRLGTSILVTSFSSPAMLARRLATVDRLSGGRMIAGLGRGYAEDEFIAAGMPLERLGARFAEFITAMRACWGNDPVEHRGEFFHIPPSQIGPKPVQSGGVALIAGASTVSAARAAGRSGIGLNPLMKGWERLETMLEAHRSGARDAGHDVGKLEVVVRANSALSATDAPAPRAALEGSVGQVASDVKRLETLGVSEIFFDPYRYEVVIDKQIELMEELGRTSEKEG
jgi:probable F420-dependent oxidoreductase